MKIRQMPKALALSVLWAWRNRRDQHRVESWQVSPNAQIGYRSIVRAGSEVGADVILGDYSYISGPRCFVQSAQIGKFCSIARQVVIGVNNHETDAVSTHPFVFSPEYGGLRDKAIVQSQKPAPIIGNDVWIGMNSVILRGVTIGDGAIVGANAVVSSDVAPYTIVAGNPAKPVRKRFDDDTILALMELRWWDWPEEKLSANIDRFRDPEDLVRTAQ